MINKVSDVYKKHIPAFVFGPRLKRVEAIFDLRIPLIRKAVIDLSFGTSRDAVTNAIGKFIKRFGVWVKGNERVNYAIIGGTLILLRGVLGFLVTRVTQYIAAKTARAVGCDVRDSLYKKILSLSKKEREKLSSSRLLTVLNADSYQVQQGVLIFIRLIVRAPFIILGALIISLILNWEIGLIFVAIVPLILFVIFFLRSRSSKEYLSIQSKLDTLSTNASETIEGEKVIRAFRKEDYENKHFEANTKDYEMNSIKVSFLNGLINPLTFAIIALATSFVILFGAQPIFSSRSEQKTALASTIITEVSYLSQIFVTLVQLTNVVRILTKAQVSRKRCDEVLSIQSRIYEKKNAVVKDVKKGEEILSFKDVCLGYKEGGNLALSNIDFTLGKGQSLGIIGGTGSGKSTILNLRERFLDVTSGEVRYKSENIKDYSLSHLHEELGLVPQKAVLFKGTIRSNRLRSNPLATDEEITDALKEARAYEFVSKYPDYLDHEVEEGGKNFSGGQRQRLCIARGIVKHPEVLILDDATSALDLLTDKQVRRNLSKYENRTKVLVSQRVSTVMDCNLILVLEGGKLIGKGTHEELLKNCPIYLETYLSQTKKEERK